MRRRCELITHLAQHAAVIGWLRCAVRPSERGDAGLGARAARSAGAVAGSSQSLRRRYSVLGFWSQSNYDEHLAKLQSVLRAAQIA